MRAHAARRKLRAHHCASKIVRASLRVENCARMLRVKNCARITARRKLRAHAARQKLRAHAARQKLRAHAAHQKLCAHGLLSRFEFGINLKMKEYTCIRMYSLYFLIVYILLGDAESLLRVENCARITAQPICCIFIHFGLIPSLFG